MSILLTGFTFAFPTRADPLQPLFTSTILKASDLQADCAVLRKALVAIHPGLFRYNSAESFDQHFDALQSEFSRDRTLGEAFVALSKFTATLECGHSFPNPFNQSKAVLGALCAGRNRLPFYFKWIDGKMIVTRNVSTSELLAPGAEVTAIDGRPTREILRAMMAIARADGSNDAKRVSLLEVSGAERYETFDLYFPLMFPTNGRSFALTIKPLNGDVQQAEVEAISDVERLAQYKANNPLIRDSEVPAWTIARIAPATKLLTMKSWALYDSKWDWKAFLERAFDEAIDQNDRALIIDLRGNEGGLSVGDVIAERLVDHELTLPGERRLVRYRKTPADLDPILDTWDDRFRDWGQSAVESSDPKDRGFYRLTRYDDDERASVIKPRGGRFSGKVAILVDASNSSATFEFALLAKRNKLATLVGAPTGGNQRGINGGAFFFCRLPATHLEVDLPIIGLYRDAGGELAPDAGVEPDIDVRPSPKDIAAGEDVVLQAALRAVGADAP